MEGKNTGEEGQPEEKEKKRDFVSVMLEKANKEDPEPKPNVIEEDPKEIEEITKKIRKKIQQG